ncbi:hypothetical protein C8A03DRAFT_14885 [Achaetomium macrosporum]|uniref:Rhodopsin domain-containing protein n=1 Tax=Achaetomium macrosporum TaxID=79813 RepID=A0AAN7CCA8_9PEZI|nr:hypothetical protein C8A03DRAFT_14885 [Achaetomium macrosporum]
MPSYQDSTSTAGPADGDRSATVVACAAVMTFLATVAVGLRFYVRGKHLRSIKSEDWCILVAMILCIVSAAFMIEATRSGLGRHVGEVSFAGMAGYLKNSYFQTLCYNLSLCFTKLSILLLYLRVLTPENARKVTWATIGIVAIYNAWALAMYLTMCIPLHKMWEGPSVPGYCHPDSVWWALTYLHIVTDFMIFVIPVPVVVGMTLPTRQKAGLLVVFTMGLFVCLISVIRTIFLNQLLYSTDPTWDLVIIANWSSAEINAAVVCACLPTLRPALARAFGPLLDRVFPEQHQSLEYPSDGAPRTIGSMPMNAFGSGQRGNGSGAPARAGSSWPVTDEDSLSLTEAETIGNQHHSKDLDPGRELDVHGHVSGVESSTELVSPPKVHVKG